uniref:LAGLIDADG endonuclease n=1 Tax=Ophiocordycipitaceae sp. TaxID=1907519 RepID=A0A7S8CTT8_9HYPO|nr:LAGLIDADG endonuclease [Ophiocordycipitaceae sp.]QUT09491.1 LAGLIDADG endonuclease [Ophiocordycipitaceae sp.]QUT09519.1 LAGLIDADG endonuclease [Ophiocordycipitaceae sp.]QUT13249.1 LAGLIDADG endonuclease [Ophiocordycipitaceae sp.]DAJ12187.1 TPA_asm: LAGLIDADG endonuclease [Ophiocordycipitaceae sp.]
MKLNNSISYSPLHRVSGVCIRAILLTYYVVALMGQNSISSFKYYFATDCMLETIGFFCYLLFINMFYLYFRFYGKAHELDANRNNLLQERKLLSYANFLLNSQKNNTKDSEQESTMQSAENWKGFPETERQLPEMEDYKFWNWFAGIIDGDGNFDIRNDIISKRRVLKQIRIKLHNRDLRILKRIQNYLHIGRIKSDKNKPYSMYIVSTKETMSYIINNLNGKIRLKVPGFKESCGLYNINYIQADYNIGLYDAYFSGLIDTEGSIVFNYTGNRIECNLEFQYNEYTSKLNFNNTILNSKPYVVIRKKSSGDLNKSKLFSSIAFKFQNVDNMLFIYDYFMKNRLYCDMKFYRVTKIKYFIEIRKYKKFPKYSTQYKIYAEFLIDWIKYKNPLWYKVPYVLKYLLNK